MPLNRRRRRPAATYPMSTEEAHHWHTRVIGSAGLPAHTALQQSRFTVQYRLREGMHAHCRDVQGPWSNSQPGLESQPSGEPLTDVTAPNSSEIRNAKT